MQIVEAEGVAFALTHGVAKVPDLDVLARQPSDSYVASTQKIVGHFAKKLKNFCKTTRDHHGRARALPGGSFANRPQS